MRAIMIFPKVATYVVAAFLTAVPGIALAADSKLVLVIGGEAYDGPPKFTVSFDGKPLGEGTVSSAIDTGSVGRFADAADKKAYVQSFDFTIPEAQFKPRAEIAVKFTNEAYGGPGSNHDRNLYVQSVAVNGGVVPASKLTTHTANGVAPNAMLGDFLVLYDGTTDALAKAPASGWRVAAIAAAPASQVPDATTPDAKTADAKTPVTAVAPAKQDVAVVTPEPKPTEPPSSEVAANAPPLKPVAAPTATQAPVLVTTAAEPARVAPAKIEPPKLVVAQADAPKPDASAPAKPEPAPQPASPPPAAAPSPAPAPAAEKPAQAPKPAVDATANACTLDKSFAVVGFNENSNALTPRLNKQLDAVAKAIGGQHCTVRLTGYSSTEGSPASNALFSVERAQNALQYLRGKGIKFARWQATGVGETKQFGPTPGANRRVVIAVAP
jgi:outer membrane protein OmpA-like peptidoglycan-associated protein